MGDLVSFFWNTILTYLFGELLKFGSVLEDLIYVLDFLLWLKPVVLGLPWHHSLSTLIFKEIHLFQSFLMPDMSLGTIFPDNCLKITDGILERKGTFH